MIFHLILIKNIKKWVLVPPSYQEINVSEIDIL